MDRTRLPLALLATGATLLGPLGATAALAQQPGYGGYYDQSVPPPAYGDPQGYDQQDDGYYDDQGGYPPPPQGGYGYQGQGGYGALPPRPSAPPPGYQGSQPSYDRGGYDDGYGQQPPAPPPPPGYNGSQPPPPPPGYQAGAEDRAQAQYDQQYAAYAQQWAQAYCVRAHADTGTGAIAGGVIGALLGSGLAGRHDRGTGALLGAGVGAVGGAAVANNSSSGATSPGCPPGYVVRGGAPAFTYAQPNYVYAAPGWYRPWVFVGGAWTYRPYPYHVWYYRHYGWGGRYYHGPRRYYRRW